MARTRRDFLKSTALGIAGAGIKIPDELDLQSPGPRPQQHPSVRTENPLGRVPVSLIIDDSTCLVNLAHFCIPPFAEVFPDRYKQPWKTLPREIPDAFVRKFAAWCHEHGVRGKYSVIPYPACVGWLDREMPGWSKKQLEASIELLRTDLSADWDFHPEMVSHTWVIDTKTGRPYPERTERFMENWGWTDGKSADQIADYMTYALTILKNVGLPCEGITTPGGFGTRALPELAQATLESCRQVFKAEIPHYFRHLYTDERSVAPRVEYAGDLAGADPRCVVSIIGCTGDWFGGWDGLTPGSPDPFITADLKAGRLVEVIARGEPAILVSHWPGYYYNGEEHGFKVLQEVSRRLDEAYDHLLWMKLSEISRYWAARELTAIQRDGATLIFRAPFACPGFTLSVADSRRPPTLKTDGDTQALESVDRPLRLRPGTWTRAGDRLTACFDLPKGASQLLV